MTEMSLICHEQMSISRGQTLLAAAAAVYSQWYLHFCVSFSFLLIFIKATLGVYQHQFAIMKHGGCIPLMCDHYTNEVNGSAVLTKRWMPPSGNCPPRACVGVHLRAHLYVSLLFFFGGASNSDFFILLFPPPQQSVLSGTSIMSAHTSFQDLH